MWIRRSNFWSLKKNDYFNIKCLKYSEEVQCGWYSQLCRLDEDRIIIIGNNENSLKVISISNMEIIKDINNPFLSFGIYSIKDKGIFLVGGQSNDIIIYKNDNYECVQIIKNAHNNFINGFIELKNGTIASFSNDQKIKIWSL